MTLEVQTPTTTKVFTGPGEYTFSNFTVYDEEDVAVYHRSTTGVDTALNYLTDYTVTLNEGAIGGHVDVTWSDETTGFLVINRELANEQLVDLIGAGKFDPETLERALDENVMRIQQLQAEIDGVMASSNWRGDWVTGAEYSLKDIVRSTNYYVCLEQHVAGTFATDLAAGKWQLIIDVASIADDVRDNIVPDPSTGTDEQVIKVMGGAYTLGDASGGLKWLSYSTNQTAAKGKGYSMDTTAGALTVTPPATPSAGDSFGVADLAGTFSTNNCTVAFNGLKLHGTVQTENMILDVKNQRVVFSYSGATYGWIITDMMPLGTAWEYMPYAVMHVQDQKPSGTQGGASIAGTQIRTLNTVLVNDIAGASLAGNQVTLPAGDYDVVASAAYYGGASPTKIRLYNVTTSSYIAEGTSETCNNATAGGAALFNFRMTLSTSSVIELRHYTWAVVSNGLGSPVSQGTEVYADLKITKIGGNYAPKPVISAARLQPMAGVVPNCQVQGFEITNTGTNQITVTKGQCLDSTLATPIAVTGSTILTPIAGNNALSTIAAVILNNGTHTCKVYADEAAMAADVGVNITHFAYIGWWQNNGSGQAKAGRLVGTGYGQAELWWNKASENAVNSLQTVSANCNTAVSLASYLPSSDRIVGVVMGAQGSGGDQVLVFGIDGTNTCVSNNSSSTTTGDTDNLPWRYTGAAVMLPILNNTVYWGRGSFSASGTHKALLQAVRFRR